MRYFRLRRVRLEDIFRDDGRVAVHLLPHLYGATVVYEMFLFKGQSFSARRAFYTSAHGRTAGYISINLSAVVYRRRCPVSLARAVILVPQGCTRLSIPLPNRRPVSQSL